MAKCLLPPVVEATETLRQRVIKTHLLLLLLLRRFSLTLSLRIYLCCLEGENCFLGPIYAANIEVVNVIVMLIISILMHHS